ncbi:RICIN domain-containing protein [Streptomyces litmocidini]|uniref:RICIN domain-containing protein n=1 Tax=Streptomyces litmocidini TaxID=67318 RepID=UPI003702DBDE
MKQVFERMRRLLPPAVGVALTASLLLPAQSAQAATLDSFSADFTLTRVDGDKSGLIASAESAGVAKAAVIDVVDPNDSRTGRPTLCHGTGLNGAMKYDGFCWDKGDDESGYTDPGGGWMPQGFSGSHDATADGLYAGRHLYAASWYFGDYYGKTNQYSRISIVESTGDRVSYGHVALVEPVNGNFKELTYKSHADGVAWYGNRLFVANGAELQVYDLTHLWKMSDTGSSAGETGLRGSGSTMQTSARYHRWALPLVARYTTLGGVALDANTRPFPIPKDANGNCVGDAQDCTKGSPRACGPKYQSPNDVDVLCLSSLSIDRSTSPPSLISVENYAKDGGRIVRWPLSQLGASQPTQVSSYTTGYTTPVYNVQGTATDGVNFYMSGDCPGSWPAGYSCIHVASPGGSTRVLSQAPWLTQGLSWDRNVGRLWGLNEALEDPDVGARRVVFSIDPGAGKEVDGWGWLSNFNKPGFVCATPQGEGTINGTVVTVYHCTGAESQRWKFENGRLRHKVSDKCLTPRGDAEGTDGAVLTLWTCGSASSQQFKPDGATITNQLGKAITPDGNSLADGKWLTLWTNNRANVQEWSVKGF